MKYLSWQKVVSHMLAICIGIAIGFQIPSIISDYKMRKYQEQAEKQVRENPHDPNNWLEVGFFKWQRGDKLGASSAIQKALEINPNYTYAQEQLANNYMELGNLVEAHKWMSKALESAKSNAPEQIEIIKFALSRIEKKMNPNKGIQADAAVPPRR